MSQVSVEEVQTRLSDVRCAVCKGNDFGIDQRFMKDDGEWKGVCKKCFYNFPVFTDMAFYLQIQPDLPYHLKEIPCMKCESRGVSLDFRIVMSVREAHYFVTCKKCGHRFPHRSTFETFE